NGRGFYLYDGGHRKPNPRVSELRRAALNGHGQSTAPLSDEDIVDRAVLIMVNEAARCLEEGVVGDPEAVDLAMIMGTGFAPFRGGLLHYADERGVSRIKERLEDLAHRYGDRFEPAPMLQRIVENGGHFYHDQPTNGHAKAKRGR
ncbi:MAG: 3-hydroxyacyl-CoA dehydrogenase family protein, partial [Planctomycetota bacterium]